MEVAPGGVADSVVLEVAASWTLAVPCPEGLLGGAKGKGGLKGLGMGRGSAGRGSAGGGGAGSGSAGSGGAGSGRGRLLVGGEGGPPAGGAGAPEGGAGAPAGGAGTAWALTELGVAEDEG